MATIIHLSVETIAIILENDNISFEDIMNFSSTCKQFQWTILNIGNKFWEKKFYQRCPSVKKKYNIEKRKKLYDQLNFREKIKDGLKYIKTLQYYISLMYENNLSNTNKKELECLLRSLVKKSMVYYFILDEINRINWQTDLTSAYYFGIILRFLKQHRLIYKIRTFQKMPWRKQLLERLFIIVVQYLKPHVSYSSMETYLNDITQEVLSHLKNNYPAHPIFSKPLEQFFFWRKKDIRIVKNFWDETPARQIMRTLEEFLFSRSQDHKLYQFLKALDIEIDIYIDHNNNVILECFKTYMLPIIYHCIARRLGIYCFVIPLEEELDRRVDILIAWKPKYIWFMEEEDLNNAEYFLQNNASLSYPSNIIRGRCYDEDGIYSVSDIEVIFTIVVQIYEGKFEKFKISDYTMWEFKTLCEIIESGIPYCSANANNIAITMPIQVKSDIVKRKQPKIRNTEIKFAIGMIVTHSSNWCTTCSSRSCIISENCCHDGVIIGWHFKYDMLLEESLSSIVPQLYLKYYEFHPTCSSKCRKESDTINQPHYIILSENNIVCYIHQDAISICSSKYINNVHTGLYFSKFEGTYYVPNERLAEEYPNDTAAIPTILFNR